MQLIQPRGSEREKWVWLRTGQHDAGRPDRSSVARPGNQVTFCHFFASSPALLP